MASFADDLGLALTGTLKRAQAPPPPPPTGGFADGLAAAFGGGPDLQGAYAKGLEARSQYSLRSAQTESALAEAEKRRQEGLRQAQINDLVTKAQADPNYAPGISDLLTMATGANDFSNARLGFQEHGFRDTLANPAAAPAAQFAAGQGVQGKVLPHLYDVGGETVNMTTAPDATFQTPAQQAKVAADEALKGQRDRSPAAAAGAAALPGSIDADYQNAVAELAGANPAYGSGAAGTAARQRALTIKAQLLANSNYRPEGLAPGVTFDATMESVQNRNRFKLGGNPTMARRMATMDAIPELLGNLQNAADEVGLSDLKPWASVQLAWRDATNDPALRSYLTQRQDILFQIAGALRSNGNTVAADKLESEAQGGKNVSPKGLRGFVDGVLKSTEASRNILHGVTTPVTGKGPPAAGADRTWTKQVSPSTGAVRWINKATGETRTEAP